MKKILLFLMTICALASVNTAKAQGGPCNLQISNLTFDQTQPGDIFYNNVTGNCEVKFTVHFDIATNSGFKWLFFHSWLTNYPNPPIFDCVNGNINATPPGEAAQLGTSITQAGTSVLDFGFIGLKDFLAGKPVDPNTPLNIKDLIAEGSEYPNNNGHGIVALNGAADAWVTKNANSLHFDIEDVLIKFPGLCNQLLDVKTDIWGSNQAGNNQYDATKPQTPQNNGSLSSIQAQCYICNQRQIFNDPSVLVEKTCSAPGTPNPSQNNYRIRIETTSPVAVNFTYEIRAFDPSVPNAAPDPANDPIAGQSAAPISLSSANSPYVSPFILLNAPYCCTGPWSSWPIYAIVYQQGVTSGILSNVSDPACATLPVNLKSFNALRKNASTVELKWETAQEQNSKGFYVQRKLSNGAWQSVDFVESKAINGQSNTPLAYAFTDLNDAKGVSQYRLRQVDIDGKQGYSEIRSVRGEGQKANTIIYPNPSNDGRVNVLFEGANTNRDVSLLDVSGRTIRQWKGITNNNIQIDNLTAGFYTVRILNTETGEQVVEKFIVNKR